MPLPQKTAMKRWQFVIVIGYLKKGNLTDPDPDDETDKVDCVMARSQIYNIIMPL